MFDPQYTRRSNRKFYTRKGQIIQAKKVEIPRTIEGELIPLYIEYFKKNHITGYIPPSPSSTGLLPPFYIQSKTTKLITFNGSYELQPEEAIFTIEHRTSEIICRPLYNVTKSPIQITINGYYCKPSPPDFPFINEAGETIIFISFYFVTESSEIDLSSITIPSRPGIILNDIQ